MYKKIAILLSLLVVSGNGCFANNSDNSLLVKGFQNLTSIQKINVINQLSAIADNDDVVFSKIWPKEYFKQSDINSYIYLTKNDTNSLDIIKFDVPKISENCMTKENPEFCIQKVIPTMETFIYDERLRVENVPNFLTNKNGQKEILEVLLKDSKLFDTMKIKSLPKSNDNEISRDCEFENDLMTKCQTFEKDTTNLISTEELILKPTQDKGNQPLKYVKYNAEGQKVEEYVFSTNKHTFYDENGNITEQEQVNDSVFKYSNKDLFIDVEFLKDENGQILEEKHYDRNHKLMRKYSATYDENGLISKIHVVDVPNFAQWDIIPIRVSKVKEPNFAIRY